MPTDITEIRDKIRKAESENSTVTNIYVHMGTCGIASGADEVLATIKRKLKEDAVKNA